VTKNENSHGCQIFPTLVTNILWSQKIRKIPKIIQKFPRLLERAENAKKAWEIPENRGKILKNIRNFPTAVKRAENAKNQKNPKNIHHP